MRIILLQILDHLFCYCRFGSLFQRVVPVYFAHSHSKSHFACCRSGVFFLQTFVPDLNALSILFMIQIGIPDFHFKNCPSRSSFFANSNSIFLTNCHYEFFCAIFVPYPFFLQFVVSEFVFANCKYIIHFLAPSYLILLVIPGRRGGESWCQKGNRPIFWPFQTISGRKYFPPL